MAKYTQVLSLHDGEDKVILAFFSEYREGLVKPNSMTQAEMTQPKKKQFFFFSESLQHAFSEQMF